MGMIPPDEVLDTFTLRIEEGIRQEGTISSTKAPVRTMNIIAEMKPRTPEADTSRNELRLGFYLLHDRPTPGRNMVRKAQGVSETVVECFSLATGGRMRIVLTPTALGP